MKYIQGEPWFRPYGRPALSPPEASRMSILHPEKILRIFISKNKHLKG
jgi:hypothetical protein